MVDARTALLEDRHDDHDAELAREPLHALGDRPRNRLGEIEALRVGHFAEVRRVEELLQADDLRAARGGFTDPSLGVVDCDGCIRGHCLLNETDREWFIGHELVSYSMILRNEPENRASDPAGVRGGHALFAGGAHTPITMSITFVAVRSVRSSAPAASSDGCD